LLLDSTHTFPWESDLSRDTLTFVGERSLDVIGYSPEHCSENGFWASQIYELDREKTVAWHRELSQKQDEFDIEYRMVTADGRVISVQDMVSVVRVRGRASWLRGFTMDVTRRNDTERALRDLGVRLMTQQEEERKRVARELHDDLSQRMAIFCIDIESLIQKGAIDQADLEAELARISTRAKEISAEIHRVAYALHPAKLDDLGLKTALNSFCNEVAERHSIEVIFRSKGVDTDIPADVRLCLFRIAQEALSNVVRHSGSRTAVVELKRTANRIGLTITDTGKGFDTRPFRVRKGLGLISMTERLRILSGDISIRSQPEKGTVVEVTVPLPKSKKFDVPKFTPVKEITNATP